MPLSAKEAIAALKANTKAFLEKNIVVIASSKKGLPGKATFSVRDNSGSGDFGYTTGLSGLFGKTKKRQRWSVQFKCQGDAVQADNEFAAIYVPMVQTTDAPSRVVLPGAGIEPDCDLMITSQLTGCTFTVGSNVDGTELWAAHIQPNQGLAETDRPGDLRDAVDRTTGDLPSKFVHARGDSYANNSTVIGKRAGASWVFFLQHHRAKSYTYQSSAGKATGTGTLMNKLTVIEA